MLKEFKEFAMRGNVVDMAVGIIIGGAFGTIVKSMVSDVLMPPIGLLMGGVDFANLFLTLKEGVTAGPYHALADAQTAGRGFETLPRHQYYQRLTHDSPPPFSPAFRF